MESPISKTQTTEAIMSITLVISLTSRKRLKNGSLKIRNSKQHKGGYSMKINGQFVDEKSLMDYIRRHEGIRNRRNNH